MNITIYKYILYIIVHKSNNVKNGEVHLRWKEQIQLRKQTFRGTFVLLRFARIQRSHMLILAHLTNTIKDRQIGSKRYSLLCCLCNHHQPLF